MTPSEALQHYISESDGITVGIPIELARAIDSALHEQAANGIVDAGAIAYQLTKRLVIDMSTARAAVDAVLKI